MQSSAFQFKTPVMRKAVFQVNEGFQNEDGGIEMPASISTRRCVDDDASTAYVEIEVLVGEKTKSIPFMQQSHMELISDGNLGLLMEKG